MKPDNILGLIKDAKPAARKPSPALPTEVAQIVYYLYGSEAAHCVRYSDMKLAKKQFDGLIAARNKAKPFVLTGASSTDAIKNCQAITVCSLCDVEVGVHFFTDNQKRINTKMREGG